MVPIKVIVPPPIVVACVTAAAVSVVRRAMASADFLIFITAS
jgi:hypothetical protein